MAVRNATLIDFTSAFVDGPGFYRGVVVAVATGSGTGSESGSGVHVHVRTGSESGSGSSSLTELHKHLRSASGSGAAGTSTTLSGIKQGRSATGSGVGSSNNAIVHKHLRTSFGVGGADTFDNAVGLHIHPRTVSNSGTGSATVTDLHTHLRSASGSGAGSEVSVSVRYPVFRPPTDNQVDLTGSDFFGIDMIPANKLVYSLYRHYQPGPRGRNVWKLKDGSFTENQPMEDSLIDRVYYGGHNHVLFEDGEKADLVAAGYGAYVT